VPQKGKGKRKERKGNQRGALATRNPKGLFEKPGELLKRSEERTMLVVRYHEPPRCTRDVPDAGPGGFVDGLDA